MNIVSKTNHKFMDQSSSFNLVSQGFRPPVISPPRGPNPQDLAPPGPNPLGSRPPCAPPFRDLAPPPPNDTFQRIFLYLDLVTEKALKYGLAIYLTMDLRESDSEPMLFDIF